MPPHALTAADFSRDAIPPVNTPDFNSAADMAGAYRLNDLIPSQLSWLWPNRIPIGRLTLLASDPGLGKSLLALDIAARLTRGKPWPDELAKSQETRAESRSPNSGSRLSTLDSRPSSVLLLTAEDDLQDTVLPRLEALGADLSKIAAIPAVRGHQFRFPAAIIPDGEHKLPPMIRTFDLWQDVSRLNLMIHAMPDCRLVIVDPITAYLGGTSEYANRSVRSLLIQLAALARYHNVAVLAISHLRKKEGAAIHRTMGSLAFVAIARAAWLLVRDAANPQRRLLLPAKNNLAPDVTGLAFTIESDPAYEQPVIRWSPEAVAVPGESFVDVARPRGRPDAERQDAAKWLRNRLASGPLPANEVKEEAEAHGFCAVTLRRAFRELRGEAIRHGKFPGGQWLWSLPAPNCPDSHVDDQKSGEEFRSSTQKHEEFERPTIGRDSQIDPLEFTL